MSIFLPGAEINQADTKDINHTMKIDKVNLGETGTFSPIFLDYLKKEPHLKQFYKVYPEKENFKEVISSRNFPDRNREILVEVLNEQYKALKINKAVENNIGFLANANTFTITTGHQLNIFSGPFYFIYKIVSCIITAATLKKEYPEYNFIPVYWMATEDHDFDEINHFNLFGKKYTWSSNQKGPVGRFDPKELKTLFEEIPEKLELFEKAYLEHHTLADATRYFVNELFGDEGLIVVDGDNSTLKSLFAPVIKDELLNNNSGRMIHETTSSLTDLGYKEQVFARDINLFYMEDQLRERIVLDGGYKVINTDLKFTEGEIVSLIDNNPEKFSPNVVLRPLYQEIILPNLAYIGGPAEVAYWLQLKQIFDNYKVNFPILMPRNFGMIVNKTLSKKINKLNLQSKDLFLELHSLKNKFITENSATNLSLENELKVLRQVYLSISHKALQVDQSLEGMIGAENAKAEKGIENIEKRLIKAEEHNQEISIKQIENIKEKLFPNNKLQERTENFLNFYINNPSILNFLIHNLDPFDFRFHVIIENE